MQSALDTGAFSSRPDIRMFSDIGMWIESVTVGAVYWLKRLLQGPCVRELW